MPTPPRAKQQVELSPEQDAALHQILAFPDREQTLGGYAGTGKTTLIRSLKKHLPDFAVCAFTGKAAHVLRRKGVPATTIHSLIYRPHKESYIDAKGDRRERWVFGRIPRAMMLATGMIVDEASMVTERIYEDLRSFDVPLIFAGDHGQLEPVGDRFNLMKSPDIILETIHRNAGEIARFAEFIRNGYDSADWPKARGKLKGRRRVQFLTAEKACESPVGNWDQWIVAFNKLRVGLNRAYRSVILGERGDLPVLGDRVMCLQNDHSLGVFNGMQGTVGALDKPNLMRFDADGREYWVEYVPEQFNRTERPEFERSKRLPFDYCYVITCHKAQGDEFDRVLVFEQRCPLWDHARWAYTAASRARVRLDWVLP